VETYYCGLGGEKDRWSQAAADLQVVALVETYYCGLGGENDRWSQAAADLQTVYDNLLGDVLIAAGVIAYLE